MCLFLKVSFSLAGWASYSEEAGSFEPGREFDALVINERQMMLCFTKWFRLGGTSRGESIIDICCVLRLILAMPQLIICRFSFSPDAANLWDTTRSLTSIYHPGAPPYGVAP